MTDTEPDWNNRPRLVASLIVGFFTVLAGVVALFLVVFLRRDGLLATLPAIASVILLAGALVQFWDAMYEYTKRPRMSAEQGGQANRSLIGWGVIVLGGIVATVATVSPGVLQ